ncbi:MAG: formylglycine-generating enzyme family protein [Bacteroidales bacterium]
MAWDHQYYDALEKQYKLAEFLETGQKYMGGYDVYSIWPTWPRLGVDRRNQWDLYEDLPGGLEKMRELSELCRSHGSKFFIAYNPWDQSTREEDPYKGMARLIEATHADGVVLDTRGSSSYELQRAADSVRSGVVMYSEGMAVPKDMPGIVAGRVHDAIYMPPPLNMNKLIKPDFGIFRVCQLSQGRISREANISLFNGYGVELNTYYPGRPHWIEEEYLYLGKVVKVLRENSTAFNSYDWTPLLPSLTDSIWVNEFPAANKTIYTVYSLIPEGYKGSLFGAEIPEGYHAVSLWNHEMLEADNTGGKTYLPVHTTSFERAWIGTRRESAVDVVAVLPELLQTRLEIDSLHVSSAGGDSIVISAGNPTYQTRHIALPAGEHHLKVYDLFGRYEGKLAVQLFDRDKQLLDERIEYLEPATPRLISHFSETEPAARAPKGMKEIPAGSFAFSASNPDPFIPYPGNSDGDTLAMRAFFMDEFPVTNSDFQRFMQASGYQPEDDANFLKHWNGDDHPDTLKDHPVVFVGLQDARAYCAAQGKRLPTEAEWQYAAQGSDGRKWPWGNDFDSTLCNNALGHTTPVDAFHGGQSPFGVKDMTGNVWQLTQDVYDNGSYYFAIMKGGSHYKPTSSWWYVKGGPQPADHQQMLLLVSPGFDRNATVGFRCVKDK